jgi:hypothetical protein
MTATIFEINATYKTYETGEIVKVLSRSMNRLTILINGETLQKQFKLNDDGVEFLQLSKWETVYADDVCDEEPNKAINTEIKRNKERLNKSLLQLAALEEYQELTYDRLLHNINSIAEDIKRLEASKI